MVIYFVVADSGFPGGEQSRSNLYRPQRSCEGYVFTPVCHSVHMGGVCLSACWDTTPPPGVSPRSRHPPPGADPSWAGTPQQTATVADGTHPTGMHSCWQNNFPKTACPPGSTTALSFFNIQLSGVDTPRGGDTRTVSAVIKFIKTCTQRWWAPKNIFLAPSRPNEPPSDFWLFATHIWPWMWIIGQGHESVLRLAEAEVWPADVQGRLDVCQVSAVLRSLLKIDKKCSILA